MIWKCENLLGLNNCCPEVNTAWSGWRSCPQDLGDQDDDDGDDGHVVGVLGEDARGAVHKTLAVKMMMVMMMIIIMATVFGDDEVGQGDVFYEDSHNDDLEMKIPTISN